MEELNFGSRLWLAFVLPFKVLFDGSFAARISRLQTHRALPSAEDAPAAESSSVDAEPNAEAEPAARAPAVSAVEAEVDTTSALQLLAILQREGRFIDFLQEDMSGFADAEIGAAARVVQEGCKRCLADYVQVRAIRREEEGAAVTLEPGYDAARVRITGNVTGQPPYRGTLAHHGWEVESIHLPRLSESHDPRVVAPAEVEL